MTFAKEPTVWLGVIRAGLYLAAHFGLKLSAEQLAAVVLFFEAVTVAVNRHVVTPVKPPSSGEKPVGVTAPEGGKDEVDGTVSRLSWAPLAALCLGLSLLFNPALFGCSGKGTKDPSAYVEQGAAFAFNGAVVALEVIDAREAAYADTLDSSKTAELEALENRVERLERVRAALEIVKGWLEGKNSEKDARAALTSAVELLSLAAKEAESHGKKLPGAVTQGLDAARIWLGAS